MAKIIDNPLHSSIDHYRREVLGWLSQWKKRCCMSAKKPVSNGKNESNRTGKRSNRAIRYPSPALQKKLRDVFDDYVEDGGVELRHDFVFHMTDWLNDLDELTRLYERPELFSKAEARQVVYGLLVHARCHIDAAARIYLGDDINDPFADLYRGGSEKGKLANSGRTSKK